MDTNAQVKPKDRRHWGTIGTHLVALVSIQLVLVLGLIGFAAIQDFRNANRDAERGVASTGALAADYVAEEVEGMRSELDQIPQFADLLASPSVCSIANNERQEAWGDGVSMDFLLLRNDGSALCPHPDGEAQPSMAGADWFKQALATGGQIEAGPFALPATGEQVMVFAISLPEHGSVIATVARLSTFSKVLNEKFGSATWKPSFLVTSGDRKVVYTGDGEISGRSLEATPFGSANRSGSTFEGLDGVQRIYAETAVPGLGWHVFTGISTSDALASARQTLRERMIFAGIMVLIVMAAAMFLQRRFVRPIRALAKVTRKASEGDLNAKVSPGGPSELNELGESFNSMLQIRKEAEAALRKAYKAERRAADELREVDGMRNAFLMAISHELRTPLTSVVGYSTFLNDSMDDLGPEEVKTSIQAIAGQSKRLERLLLDLLDVERLSRGIVEPHLMDTDVSQLVMRVIESSSGNGRIRADVKSGVMAHIDPALVERMVENLVFNAIKHTPQDTKIKVKARRVNGHLRLAVEDTGNGVPDELKVSIFEPFKQGDVPAHSPGTGVGLSLVAQFAKLHGGRAWVEDRRGGGAAFQIELPAKPAGKRTHRRTKAAA